MRVTPHDYPGQGMKVPSYPRQSACMGLTFAREATGMVRTLNKLAKTPVPRRDNLVVHT